MHIYELMTVLVISASSDEAFVVSLVLSDGTDKELLKKMIFNSLMKDPCEQLNTVLGFSPLRVCSSGLCSDSHLQK